MDPTATKPAPAAPAAAPRTISALDIGHTILTLLADLRITVALFALAMLIVFWGTLAQVDYGVWTIVQKYFRSFYVLVPMRVVLFNQINDNGWWIPFPGGWAIGTAMMINLLAAHAVRFKLTWARGGIILIHAGIVIMMVSEIITGLYAIEGQMVIQIGGATNSITHPGRIEFVLIKNIDAQQDEVTTVPGKLLTEGAVIDDPRLPFKMEVIQYMVNSDLRGARPGEVDADAKGQAAILVAVQRPEVSGVNPNQRHDAPSMYVWLTDRNTKKKLGKYLFSAHLDPEWLQLEGDPVKYRVGLRFKQAQQSYTIHLDNFEHKKFVGTETPRDFHSYIRLTDEKAGILEPGSKHEIYMNAPMTYNGQTFYQQSWTTDPLTGKANGTVLQVVRNPGWALPYISCLVVGVGLLYHFGITLYRFVDRRIIR
jgi:hypothetical protein